MAHQSTPSAGLTIKLNRHNLHLIFEYFDWVKANGDAETKAKAAELLGAIADGRVLDISARTLTLLYHYFVFATTRGDAATVAKTWELLIIVDDEGEGKLDPPPNGDPNG